MIPSMGFSYEKNRKVKLFKIFTNIVLELSLPEIRRLGKVQ